MNKRILIRKIVNILKSVSEANRFDFRGSALSLCESYGMIEEACQIYQAIVDSTTHLALKCEYLEKYAMYCIEFGRIEQALIIYQKKLSMEEDY